MENILKNKSFVFAVKIVQLCRYLQENKEFILSRQILKSGTAIGAMVNEAKFAQSKPDFISKLSIALKEANETLYWLELLETTDYLLPDHKKLQQDCDEIIAILVTSIKTAKFHP